jgi:hypothetical protein
MGLGFDDWYVTPKRKKSDFTFPLSIEDKINIFYERIDGWQLNIADQLAGGVTDRQGRIIDSSESAYAVLQVIFSFFEMIAKYHDGYTGMSNKPYFEKGVKSIFPEMCYYPKLMDALYRDVRCGLYHVGYTSPLVFIRNDIPSAIALTNQGRLWINPQILVSKLREYFRSYTKLLKNVTNTQLRRNFEIRFDFDSAL